MPTAGFLVAALAQSQLPDPCLLAKFMPAGPARWHE